MRLSFCGPSGTGKTTLATYVAERYGLPLNPVGSRSVSRAMGFDSPYDVDRAGKRAEFQRRLLEEKRAWEDAHDSFVVDRTTLDNLTYTVMHDLSTIDDAMLASAIAGMHRYEVVIYCPAGAFIQVGDDPARVRDATYHRLFDAVISGMLARLPGDGRHFPTRSLWDPRLERRKAILDHFFTKA